MTTDSDLKALIAKRNQVQNQIKTKEGLLNVWEPTYRENYVKHTSARMTHLITQASAKSDEKSAFVPRPEDILSEKVQAQASMVMGLRVALSILEDKLKDLNTRIDKEQKKSTSLPPSPINQKETASSPPSAKLITPSRSPSPIHLQPSSSPPSPDGNISHASPTSRIA